MILFQAFFRLFPLTLTKKMPRPPKRQRVAAANGAKARVVNGRFASPDPEVKLREEVRA